MDVLTPIINWGLCQACQPCEAQRACKPHAIVRFDPEDLPWIEYDRCNHCIRCVAACTSEAIGLRGRDNAF